jgi:DNA invertase Pin-like site-specific DNA recombinase
MTEYTKPKTNRGWPCGSGMRASAREQSFDLQLDSLRQAGCERICTEAVSGARAERPVLNELLLNIRAGYVLVTWKLDRLGRSLAHLVELVGLLMNKEVGLVSLHDSATH